MPDQPRPVSARSVPLQESVEGAVLLALQDFHSRSDGPTLTATLTHAVMSVLDARPMNYTDSPLWREDLTRQVAGQKAHIKELRAVLGVLGERDAEIRQHLEAILETAFRHPSGDIEAERAIHARAALLLLTPDEQDAP